MAKPFPHPHWNLRGGKGPTEVGAWTMPSHAWLLWAVAASCPRPNKLCGSPSLLPKQILELGYSSLFSLDLMKGSSLFPTVWRDTVRVLESPPDLSPEVALTHMGMHLALPWEPTHLTVRRGLAWVAFVFHTALNLLTEPAASVSWGARVSEIPGLSLQAICGVQVDSTNTYHRSVSKNRAFQKGKVGLSLAP